MLSNHEDQPVTIQTTLNHEFFSAWPLRDELMRAALSVVLSTTANWPITEIATLLPVVVKLKLTDKEGQEVFHFLHFIFRKQCKPMYKSKYPQALTRFSARTFEPIYQSYRTCVTTIGLLDLQDCVWKFYWHDVASCGVRRIIDKNSEEKRVRVIKVSDKIDEF